MPRARRGAAVLAAEKARQRRAQQLRVVEESINETTRVNQILADENSTLRVMLETLRLGSGDVCQACSPANA